MTARETKPTPAELWERAGYLRAAATAAYVDANAYAAYVAAADAAAAYAAYAAVDADAADDAYDAGMARWAREHPREHPPKEVKP